MKRVVAINLISFSNTKSVGTFVFTKRILTELLKNNSLNFLFIIYLQKGISPNDFGIPNSVNVQIVEVPSFKSSILRILFEQTFFYLYLKKCDVFFTPSLSLPLFVRGKKVLTIHDMIPFWDKKKYSCFIRYYVICMTYLAAKVSDKIVTVSKCSKCDIIRLLKIRPSKISVIYNFILDDEPVVRSQNNAFVDLENGKRLNLNVPFFLTVSTLQPAKNIDGLINAFSLFVQENSSYYLYIVGNKGWNYSNLFDLVASKRLNDRVIFTGYLNDEKLSSLYSKCVGVVYVSYYEGFGIPPLEGFFHGKVCVASNLSSMPEVVGNAGVLVDPYDICSIKEGMNLLISMKKQLERYIPIQLRKFAPQKQIQKLLSLFLE